MYAGKVEGPLVAVWGDSEKCPKWHSLLVTYRSRCSCLTNGIVAVAPLSISVLLSQFRQRCHDRLAQPLIGIHPL
jgi:hypothetical protein